MLRPEYVVSQLSGIKWPKTDVSGLGYVLGLHQTFGASNLQGR